MGRQGRDMDEYRESFTEEECLAEFARLFPDGFAGPDVRNEVAIDTIVDTADQDADEAERNISSTVLDLATISMTGTTSSLRPSSRHVVISVLSSHLRRHAQDDVPFRRQFADLRFADRFEIDRHRLAGLRIADRLVEEVGLVPLLLVLDVALGA